MHGSGDCPAAATYIVTGIDNHQHQTFTIVTIILPQLPDLVTETSDGHHYRYLDDMRFISRLNRL